MSRRALIIALAAALITGSSLGLVGGILFARHSLFAHADQGFGPRGERHGEHGPRGKSRGDRRGGPSANEILTHLTRELDLDEAQSERIRLLVVESRSRVQSERDSLHARIGRELTPEQLERWTALPRPHRFGAQGSGAQHDRP